MSNDLLRPLICKAINGDRDAFEQLLISQRNIIGFWIRNRISCPEDVDDIEQEVAMRIYKHISSLECPEAFRAWLHKIVERECTRHFEMRNSISSFESNGLDDIEDISSEDIESLPFAHVELLDLRAEIRALLGHMPETVREVTALHCFEEMRYREIAANLGIPIGTVCANLYRARIQLRKKLNWIR